MKWALESLVTLPLDRARLHAIHIYLIMLRTRLKGLATTKASSCAEEVIEICETAMKRFFELLTP